jgi:hypothetical protein
VAIDCSYKCGCHLPQRLINNHLIYLYSMVACVSQERRGFLKTKGKSFLSQQNYQYCFTSYDHRKETCADSIIRTIYFWMKSRSFCVKLNRANVSQKGLNATLRAVFNWNDRHVARIQLLLMQRNHTTQILNISREGTALLVGVISTYRKLTSNAFLRFLNVC